MSSDTSTTSTPDAAAARTEGLAARVADLVVAHEPTARALRRDVHAHPELAHQEHRTTARIAELLADAGVAVRLLPGTGLIADIGPDGPRVGVRADIDALPVPEATGLPYASTAPGVAHACGHDVHTASVLGAGLVLADLARAGALRHGVRLVFQPAEEVMPGGALGVIGAGVLDGVAAIYGLHCDPSLDAGTVGLKAGPITSASDHVTVRLRGTGGHTSRPHLAGDLVFALGQVVTQLPAVIARRVDPRAGVNLTWGAVHAGDVANAVPAEGYAAGTLRCMETEAWQHAGELVESVVADLVRPYSVRAEVSLVRGVPPVDNEVHSTAALDEAARALLGPDGVLPTRQSLGGEDFAWYLHHVPGAMVRLGTRTPGGTTYDLHRGDYAPDEAALAVGIGVLAVTAASERALPAGLQG
ncbi:amidohydrolase [Kineococcus radiotolerans]|uniref:Amidohydrolase n=1 Tax=Kineococcus radiotolerans TaxID=131568 RepID=A0A7W4TNS8_KINRA|nr:amidohydrolase [Kineococcus radiotolerans]MBB2902289.1 amidohydrolase [Kineococcus radiotolerans]